MATFERPETPEEEQQQAEAFFKTLGPVMLVQGFESIVTAARDAESGEFQPALLVRFEGRINGTPEMVTSTLMLSPGDTESLVQMLAEQAVLGQAASMPTPGSDGWTEGFPL